MQNIAENLARVRAQIAAQAARHGRSADAVRLLAVSKTQPAALVRQAAASGQMEFGENYLQEAAAKMDELADLPLVWHFIGPVQSNKTRAIATRFHWVHSVDRERTARRLSDARAPELGRLNVCIQVNISGEDTKSGAAPEAVTNLAAAIKSLPGLRLRGLMALPEPTPDHVAQRAAFARVRTLLDELSRAGHAVDTLSMGTSADVEAAIAEGATLVRIGTALFGPRDPLRR